MDACLACRANLSAIMPVVLAILMTTCSIVALICYCSWCNRERRLQCPGACVLGQPRCDCLSGSLHAEIEQKKEASWWLVPVIFVQIVGDWCSHTSCYFRTHRSLVPSPSTLLISIFFSCLYEHMFTGLPRCPPFALCHTLEHATCSNLKIDEITTGTDDTSPTNKRITSLNSEINPVACENPCKSETTYLTTSSTGALTSMECLSRCWTYYFLELCYVFISWSQTYLFSIDILYFFSVATHGYLC
jgi:hypothetical protein